MPFSFVIIIKIVVMPANMIGEIRLQAIKAAKAFCPPLKMNETTEFIDT
jgi:hypothetical protein